jgi:hypothetical protein
MSGYEAGGPPPGVEPVVHWLRVLFGPRPAGQGVAVLRHPHMPALAVEAGPVGAGERPVEQLLIATGNAALTLFGLDVHYSRRRGMSGVTAGRTCTGCDSLVIDAQNGLMGIWNPQGRAGTYYLGADAPLGIEERKWAAELVEGMVQAGPERDPTQGGQALELFDEFAGFHQIEPLTIARVRAAVAP